MLNNDGAGDYGAAGRPGGHAGGSSSSSRPTSAPAQHCRYPSFDPAEWRLQRCRRRLANMDMDSAFDRAEARHKCSRRHWGEDKEEEEEAGENARKDAPSRWAEAGEERKRRMASTLETPESKQKKAAEKETSVCDGTKMPFQGDSDSNRDEGKLTTRPRFDNFKRRNLKWSEDACPPDPPKRKSLEEKVVAAPKPRRGSISEVLVGYYMDKASKEAANAASKARMGVEEVGGENFRDGKRSKEEKEGEDEDAKRSRKSRSEIVLDEV